MTIGSEQQLTRARVQCPEPMVNSSSSRCTSAAAIQPRSLAAAWTSYFGHPRPHIVVYWVAARALPSPQAGRSQNLPPWN